MRLAPHEFIRRFLLHVLPDSFHRIRHYGFLARGERTLNLERVRSLLCASSQDDPAESVDPRPQPDALGQDPAPCPDCGGAMRRVGPLVQSPTRPFWCNTS